MSTRYITAFLAGIVCIPATFVQTRNGHICLSLFIVIIIGAAEGIYSLRQTIKTVRHVTFWKLPLIFALGAFVAQVASFVGYNTYYFGYGWDDPLLYVGFAFDVIEWCAISIVGGASMTIAHVAARLVNREKP